MKKLLLSLLFLLPLIAVAQEKDMKQMDDLVSKFMFTKGEQFTTSLEKLLPIITPLFDEEDLQYWSIYSEQKFQEDIRLYFISQCVKYLTDEDIAQLTKASENKNLVSAMKKMEQMGDVFSSTHMQKFLGWLVLSMKDPSSAASQKPQIPCSLIYKELAIKFFESKGMQMQIHMLLDNKKEQLKMLDGQLRKFGYSTTELIQDVYLSLFLENGITEQELRLLTVIYNMQGYVHMQKGISEMVANSGRMLGSILKHFYLFEAQEKMKQAK